MYKMYKPLGTIVIAAAIVSLGVGYTMGVGPFESKLELSHERFYAIKGRDQAYARSRHSVG
jgi:hypothetical protein